MNLLCPFGDRMCSDSCALAVVGEGKMIDIDDNETDYYACAFAVIAQNIKNDIPEQFNAQCMK